MHLFSTKIFPVMRYFTLKLEFVSNILWMIVDVFDNFEGKNSQKSD